MVERLQNIINKRPVTGNNLSLISLISGLMMHFNCGSGATALAIKLANSEFDPTGTLQYLSNEKKHEGGHAFLLSSTNLRLNNLPAVIIEAILSGKTSIANISSCRNPFTRFISNLSRNYFFQTKTKLDYQKPFKGLLEFCENARIGNDNHFTAQIDFLLPEYVEYDFLIRFEDFEKDMKLVFPNYENRQAISEIDKRGWQELFKHTEIYDYVCKTFERDFQQYGYSMNVDDYLKYDNQKIPRNIQAVKEPKYQDIFAPLRGQSIQAFGYPPIYADKMGDLLEKKIFDI